MVIRRQTVWYCVGVFVQGRFYHYFVYDRVVANDYQLIIQEDCASSRYDPCGRDHRVRRKLRPSPRHKLLRFFGNEAFFFQRFPRSL